MFKPPLNEKIQLNYLGKRITMEADSLVMSMIGCG